MHYVPYLEGRFHTASPDSQGVPSGAILQFLTELDRLDVDLHSLYIFRNGFQLLGANRRPYQGDAPRRIYSAAKALTGLAVLFAIQEGLVSLKTRLTQLFPGRSARNSHPQDGIHHRLPSPDHDHRP